MKNCIELRNELSDVFMRLKAGTLPLKTAAELANIGGKMVRSADTQIKYYALRKETPDIPFLNEPVKK